MLGLSYGEILLLLGATAALIGPKDLPRLAKVAGSMAGRAVGYVQLARGQLENVMQETQFRQVNKELQDTMAQLEAIRHEIRSISIMNPGPLTRTLMDNAGQVDTNPGVKVNSMPPDSTGEKIPNLSEVSQQSSQPREQQRKELKPALASLSKDDASTAFGSSDLHGQAIAFARLAESQALRREIEREGASVPSIDDVSGLSAVFPVSAESAGLLPTRQGEQKGSDIVLEAVLEAEVARNAKDFFSQPQNQIKFE